jgi:aryl-alcohol dehydrogenase-like predicted oxidoreductase
MTRSRRGSPWPPRRRRRSRTDLIPRVVLGATGIETSRLAIGTGTGGWAGRSRQTDLGVAGFADVLVHAFARGITYIDAADEYGSHAHVREALKRIPRDRVVLTTKTTTRTAAGMRSDLDRFRRELGTDYLDMVLLHCMTSPRWNTDLRPVMDVLSEAKGRGVIRAHGTSHHSLGALRTTAAEPWADVVLIRLNAAGMQMEGPPGTILGIAERMRAAGKGLTSMKVMGGGPLGLDALAALRWQVERAPVHAISIGMESVAQVDDDVRLLGECLPVPA